MKFWLKILTATGTASDPPNQPRLDRVQHLLPRNTRSFFRAKVDDQDEEVGDGRQHEMMVKSLPRATFVVIEPQVGLIALEELLNGEASPAQTQTTLWGGFGFEPR